MPSSFQIRIRAAAAVVVPPHSIPLVLPPPSPHSLFPALKPPLSLLHLAIRHSNLVPRHAVTDDDKSRKQGEERVGDVVEPVGVEIGLEPRDGGRRGGGGGEGGSVGGVGRGRRSGRKDGGGKLTGCRSWCAKRCEVCRRGVIDGRRCYKIRAREISSFHSEPTSTLPVDTYSYTGLVHHRLPFRPQRKASD